MKTDFDDSVYFGNDVIQWSSHKFGQELIIGSMRK